MKSEKMKAKEGGGKSSSKGKVIIGIALAAIMLASVFGALAPTSARDSAGAIEPGDVVYRGEHGLDVSAIIASGGMFYGMAGSTADGQLITVSDEIDFDVLTSYKVGPYNITSREGAVADLFIDEPEIGIDVLVGGDSIVGMSIPQGTIITVRATPNFGSIMKDATTGNDVNVKIKFTKPNGITVTYVVLACSSEFDICFATDETWSTGTWKVKITTDKATCNQVDISSSEVAFTVRTSGLAIEAEDDEVGKGDDIIIKVIGDPKTEYYLAIENVKTGEEPEIKASSDVVQVGEGEGETGAKTAAWIKTGSDGVADIAIATTGADMRTYEIHVWEIVAGKVPQPYNFVAPAAVTHDGLDDDVQVTVVPATVTFDVPATAIIGEVVEIKGAINAGDKVDIVIKDEMVVKNDKAVDENKEFSVDWDTGGMTPGSYTIEGYIDCPLGPALSDYVGVDPDGNTTIRLISPGLNATQTRNFIAEDDDYTINGTATGVDEVDIVLIGPNGYPPADPGLDVFYGLEILSTSVTDNEFSEDITMAEGLDLGSWVTMVFSPGRDVEYGDLGIGACELAEGIDLLDGSLDGCYGAVANKTQDQIVEILMDHTIGVLGSDDLLVELTFEVETPYVRMDPIESITIGEPLEISGTTNRESGTMIVIYTIEGPIYLPAAITEVEWPTPDQCIFNATIDTTEAVAGNYTLRADDGDGNTDTAIVEICEAVSIFGTGAGTYPSIMGTLNGTITPSYNINVSTLYTYPCVGTGGHTESIELYENGIPIANGTWNGYIGDYHNITLHNVSGTPYVMLLEEHKYNYTIITGSYPQIIHARSKNVTGGVINCTEFIDANGKEYNNWIPAIRLE